MRHHRSRRPLPALTTVAAAVVVAAGGIVLSPVAAADQPTLQCADGGFMCEGPGRFGSLSASYADDQPGPSVSWGTPTVTLLDSPADALDVEPRSEITRNYGIEIPSQASPDSPRRVSLLITNGTGLFAGPADMRFHITDEAGTELPAGTCTPEEQRLSPGERATVTCAVPDGGALLKAFRRGDFGGEYLAAWRLHEAKYLLITHRLGVAETCHEVGYTSVGTFSRRFLRDVGTPPGALRRIADRVAERTQPPVSLLVPAVARIRIRPEVPEEMRRTLGPAPYQWIGTFPRPVPSGLPATGTLRRGIDEVELPVVPGSPWILATIFPDSVGDSSE